ncbi:unnamed protein product [Cochlearia groenlandica]
MEIQQHASKKSKSNLSLPDDLIISCLARVSRLYYPTLSLASKSFRSLIASPELYQTRSLLSRTESCLYVCLRYSPDSNPLWFTLCRKPHRTLTKNNNKKRKKTKKEEKEEKSGNLLVPIQKINAPPPPSEFSNIVSVGSYLYAVTGEDGPCTNVYYLDCRNNNWLEAPSLRIANTDSELDGKMYLPTSSENRDSLKCVEAFSTKTKSWKPVQGEKWEIKELEGKIYMICDTGFSKKGLALKPKDFTWEAAGLCGKKDWASFCMIGEIVFGYTSSEEFVWQDESNVVFVVRKIMGLEGLPKFPRYSNVRLVNYGGKLIVLWDKFAPGSKYKQKIIWCAEISLEKRIDGEIWGKVEWFDAVLTVPKAYKFVCAVASTL